MSSTLHSKTVIEHPNADVIAGLRQAAAWLAQHPELPKVYYASISFGSGLSGDDARARLTQFAEALGDRATENPRDHMGDVEISAAFGGVRVYASASRTALAANVPPPPPPYEPIITVEPEYHDDALDVLS